MTGLYVHIPFCSSLCPYCDFAVVVGRTDAHARYAQAIATEARAAAFPGPVDSVFVGGGTPTFVDAGIVAGLLDDLRAIVGVAADAEITVEANPESVRRDAMQTLRAAGVDRVSIGAQSFRPHVLAALGRGHEVADIAAAVGAVRAAGIGNVNLDLIYGTSGESVEDWRTSLEAAIALEPQHVSCYALTIEERTAFGKAVARGVMSEPEQDALAERYELGCDLLAAAGYEHYELSNWARPGRACRHNLAIWEQGSYLGLGVGAHSHLDGHRWWNGRALGTYLADPARAREGEETLDARARAEEWLLLRLRLTEGTDLAQIGERLGSEVRNAAERLPGDGLASTADGRLRLTTRGMLLENEVAYRLLAAGDA